MLLDLAVEIPRDREDYGGPAFEYLSQALAEVPSQSERVRAAATEFLAEIDALGGVARPWTCTSSCRTEAIPSRNSPSR